MSKLSKQLLLTAVLCVAVGGCGSAPTNSVSTGNVNAANSTVTNKPANTVSEAKTPAKTEEVAAIPAGETVGIPECDDYIAKYEACVKNKVPEAQRATFNSGIETMRKSWKTAASNPQTKSALAGGCKQALETAKQSMSQFACQW